MRNRKSIFGSVIASMALLIFVGCSDDANSSVNPTTEQSSVRVIHASYDAPAVDIRVDGNVAISNLDYGQSSGYAELNSGTRNISVTPTGASSPVVINADLNLNENAEYTVYAVNVLGSIEAIVSEDNRTTNSSKAQVRFIHASPDAPAVDIKLNNGSGPAVFSNVSFKDMEAYAQVDPGSYVFAVTPAGSTSEVVVFDPVDVQAGMLYTVLAMGTLNASDQYPFLVRVFVDNGSGNAFLDLSPGASKVMVVHASPDAPGVDLLVDDSKVNSMALTFPNNTGYLDLDAGTRNFKVNASGSAVTVIDADAALAPMKNYSVFAVDALSNIAPIVLEDDLATPASGMAHVRFAHLSPDAPGVDITLTDGTVIFGDYEFKESSEFTPLNAGIYDLQVRVAGTSTVALSLDNISLQSGKVYTVFAKGFLNGSGGQALGAEIIVNN
jgi:hypothetical protein